MEQGRRLVEMSLPVPTVVEDGDEIVGLIRYQPYRRGGWLTQKQDARATVLVLLSQEHADRLERARPRQSVSEFTHICYRSDMAG